ncbi:MAG TPA: hypothetical protein VM204_05605, partial [Gaiellaceae bacterium]|nr:hypothetical protein [Gaiellaceae bacterium]
MPRLLVALIALLLLPAAADAATWQRTTLPQGAERLVAPVRAAAFAVDRAALRAQALRGGASLPGPDGRLVRFELRDAPVMEPGLARRFPSIRTFAGRAVGDRATTVRLAVTPLGVHASVRDADGTAWYVEPA